MRACSFIFWSLIVPIVTYASELWVTKEEDIKLLDDFQVYAGRRVQRFSPSTPRETSFVGLGWMRLENFIAGKKLIFARTICKMDDVSPVKRIFKQRCIVFSNNMEIGLLNEYDSPTFSILKMALCFGLYNDIMKMAIGAVLYPKKRWSAMVWSKAWQVEDEDWVLRSALMKYTLRLNKTIGVVCYLVWWQISDVYPKLMKMSETMAKIVCRTSLLRGDDYRCRRGIDANQTCQLCDLYEREDANHVIMHCTFQEDERTKMFNNIDRICPSIFIEDPDILNVLLGKNVQSIEYEKMVEVWICAGKAICNMYYAAVRTGTGIG